jgi:pyruvate/2-oxoglutarate dehydrogenase complex dihydrolipoamide acyltransferase (E2) component
VPWPKIRNVIKDLVDKGRQTNTISGFTEVDITLASDLMKKHQVQSGKALSLMAYIISCYAKAIADNKMLHAFRKGKNKLVLFDDVDVNTIVEKTLKGGIKVPVSYIVRAADKKNFFEINEEIRAAMKSDLSKDPNVKMRRKLTKQPRFIRQLIWRRIEKYPELHKQHRGTVGVTNVGSFMGGRAGWALPITPFSCTLTMGTVYTKEEIINGKAEKRKKLCITLSVNHDIVDGAPASRFADNFVRQIEQAAGIPVLS